jgi:hypothetical protein
LALQGWVDDFAGRILTVDELTGYVKQYWPILKNRLLAGESPRKVYTTSKSPNSKAEPGSWAFPASWIA